LVFLNYLGRDKRSLGDGYQKIALNIYLNYQRYDLIQRLIRFFTRLVYPVVRWGVRDVVSTNHDYPTPAIYGREERHRLLTKEQNSVVVLLKIEDFDALEEQMKINAQAAFIERIFTLIPSECAFEEIYLLDHGEFALVKSYVGIPKEHIKKQTASLQAEINRAKIKIEPTSRHELSVIMSVAFGNQALMDAEVGLQELIASHRSFIFANGLHDQQERSLRAKIETFKMIETAIASSKVLSLFQPIVDNRTQEVQKYESLIRIETPTGEMLPPSLFFEVSKRSKYHLPLMKIVLENSFAALENTPCDISLNLSIRDLEQEEIRERFLALIAQHRSEAHRIILELLEDEEGKELMVVQDFIRTIKGYGIKIAIDDFGVGYSNFERILNYQPDFLKIDGGLIKTIHTNPYAYSIVEAIVAFAHKEHLKVIAEFVENEAIFRTLCEIGVDYSQGYYFGKPSPLL